MFYAVVTFGRPASPLPRFTRSRSRACSLASQAMGSGSCSCARVYECRSRKLALSADISEIRAGEAVIYHA